MLKDTFVRKDKKLGHGAKGISGFFLFLTIAAMYVLLSITYVFAGFTAPNSTSSPRLNHTATLLDNGKVLITGGSLDSHDLDTAEVYDPTSESFTPVGHMTTARSNHAATLLPGGKVLITGGYGAGYGDSSAELFDPATGTFIPTGTMAEGHSRHCATLLPSGMVLITAGSLNGFSELYDPAAGTFTLTGKTVKRHGWGTSATPLLNGKILVVGGTSDASAELYDPASGTFRATGSMTVTRSEFTATRLDSGLVLFAGGNDFGTADTQAELYDPLTEKFSSTGAMNSSRHGHCATPLKDGKVLMAGGYRDGNAELFDPLTGTFSATGALTTQRFGHTATRLTDGSVFIVGGYGNDGVALSVTERYQPETGNFGFQGSMVAARSNHTATVLADGRVLLAGGVNALAGSSELYDPATGLFAAAGNLGVIRSHHTATRLSDGKVLIAGGYGGYDGNSYGPLSSTEIFDPATGTFSAGKAMTASHEHHTATLLQNGKVLIAGGFGNAGDELYDPVANSFSAVAGMVTPRWGHTATLLADGKVLIAGGSDDSGALASAELYDPASNTFAAIDGMTSPRLGHTATVLPDGSVLIVGGYSYLNGYGGDSYYTSAERFDPVSHSFSPAGAVAWAMSGGHTATLLPDGRVLIAGGGVLNASGNDAVIYDPTTGIILDAGRMVTRRSYQSATLLGNGKVLLAGGTGSDTGPLRGAELFTYLPQAVLSIATSYPYGGVEVRTTPSDLTGKGGGTAPLSMIYNQGTTLTLTAPDSAGLFSNFMAWSGCDSSAATSCTITLASDRSVTAVYTTPPEVSISVEASPPGLAFRADGTSYTGAHTFSWPRGSTHDLAADAVQKTNGSDYYFSSWSDGGAREHQVTIDSPMTFAVTFSPTGFSASGRMSTDRYSHTATLLSDGKVLIAGGVSQNSGHLLSVELFDPASESFTVTGSLSKPRAGHRAALLPDGRVLLVGSYSAPADTELFDPGTGSFSAAASLVWGRVNPTAVLLATGKVLVAGGENSQFQRMQSAELYDPLTGTFYSTGSMAQGRAHGTATLLPNGKVLLAGGVGSADRSAELYDPVSGLFSPTGAMVLARSFHSATLLASEKVLIAGGYSTSAELYDPATGVFTATGDMAWQRSEHAATLLPDGKVLITGGIAYTPFTTSLTSAELYDPDTETFSTTGSMASPRSAHTATLLYNGKVLLAGGINGENSTELYQPLGGSLTGSELEVSSVDSGRGAAVYLSPPDIFGNGLGITPFKRTYRAGAKVRLVASAAAGMGKFVRWQGCAAGNDLQCDVTMDAATKVTAIYVSPLYGLSVSITGTGSGSINGTSGNLSGSVACSSPPLSGVCQTTQSAGTELTLRATPGGDSTFGGWGNGCSGCTEISCLVKLDSDKNCSAGFNIKQLVEIAGPLYFASLVKAYDQLQEGTKAVIKAKAEEITENTTFDRNIMLTFHGGYDTGFGTLTGFTRLNGVLKISKGLLIVERLIVQ